MKIAVGVMAIGVGTSGVAVGAGGRVGITVGTMTAAVTVGCRSGAAVLVGWGPSGCVTTTGNAGAGSSIGSSVGVGRAG